MPFWSDETSDKLFKVLQNSGRQDKTNIKDVVCKGETLLWVGGPQFKPYFLNSLKTVVPGLLVILATIILSAIMRESNILLILIFWVGVIFSICPVAFFWSLANNTEYGITDKRIILKKGLLFLNFSSVNYDDIAEVNMCEIGHDRQYGSKSIAIKLYADNHFGKEQKEILLHSLKDPLVAYRSLRNATKKYSKK